MNVTELSHILSSIPDGSGPHRVVVPEDWLQGRTTYGGLSAAVCVAAAQRALSEQMPLRSAQFCFIGPTFGEMKIVTSLLRRGKGTTLLAVDLHGQDGLAVRGTLVFGNDRPSAYSVRPDRQPRVAAPENCEPFFGGPGTPAFASHFDARRAGGAGLVSGSEVPDFLVWVRHLDQAPDMGIADLVALGDALPPPAMALFEQPAPISTITWSMDFPEQAAATECSAWHLISSRAETVSLGYSTQSMRVWSEEGEALMIGRQNVAIFA